MANSFEEYTLKFLEKAGNVVDKAVDTLQAEVPLVVKEFLQWKFIEAGMNVGACTLVFLVLGVIVWQSYKQLKKDPDSVWFMLCPAVVMIALMIAAPGADISFKNAKTMLKIKYAPRIYLIEYTSDLIKSHQIKNENPKQKNH